MTTSAGLAEFQSALMSGNYAEAQRLRDLRTPYKAGQFDPLLPELVATDEDLGSEIFFQPYLIYPKMSPQELAKSGEIRNVPRANQPNDPNRKPEHQGDNYLWTGDWRLNQESQDLMETRMRRALSETGLAIQPMIVMESNSTLSEWQGRGRPDSHHPYAQLADMKISGDSIGPRVKPVYIVRGMGAYAGGRADYDFSNPYYLVGDGVIESLAGYEGDTAYTRLMRQVDGHDIDFARYMSSYQAQMGTVLHEALHEVAALPHTGTELTPENELMVQDYTGNYGGQHGEEFLKTITSSIRGSRPEDRFAAMRLVMGEQWHYGWGKDVKPSWMGGPDVPPETAQAGAGGIPAMRPSPTPPPPPQVAPTPAPTPTPTPTSEREGKLLPTPAAEPTAELPGPTVHDEEGGLPPTPSPAPAPIAEGLEITADQDEGLGEITPQTGDIETPAPSPTVTPPIQGQVPDVGTGIQGSFKPLERLEYKTAGGLSDQNWAWHYAMPGLTEEQREILLKNRNAPAELFKLPEWQAVKEDIVKQLITSLNLPGETTSAVYESWLLADTDGKGNFPFRIANTNPDSPTGEWAFIIREDVITQHIDGLKTAKYIDKDWKYTSASTRGDTSQFGEESPLREDETMANGDDRPANLWDEFRTEYGSTPPGTAFAGREFNTYGEAFDWLSQRFPNASAAELEAMMARGEFHIAPGGPFGGIQIIRGPAELADIPEKPFEPSVVPDPRTGGLLQMTEDEWKALGLGAAPAKLEFEGGILWIRDTQGNLTPVKDVMEYMISGKIIDGDLEGAMQWDDFADRPNPQEGLQMMLEYARTPADQVVLSAIARGYGEGLIPPNAGQLSRVGPIPAEATQAWDRYQRAIGGPGREQSDQIAAEAQQNYSAMAEENDSLAEALADAETQREEDTKIFSAALNDYASGIHAGESASDALAGLGNAIKGTFGDSIPAEVVDSALGGPTVFDEEGGLPPVPSSSVDTATTATTGAGPVFESIGEENILDQPPTSGQQPSASGQQPSAATALTAEQIAAGGIGAGVNASPAILNQAIAILTSQLASMSGWSDAMLLEDMQRWTASNPGSTAQDKLNHYKEMQAKGMMDDAKWADHMSLYPAETTPSRHSRGSVRGQLQELLGDQWDVNSGAEIDKWFMDFGPEGPTDADVSKFMQTFVSDKKADNTLVPADITKDKQNSWEWWELEDYDNFATDTGNRNEKTKQGDAVKEIAPEHFPDDYESVPWKAKEEIIDKAISGGLTFEQFPEDLGTPSQGGDIPIPASVPESTAPANQTMVTDEDMPLATPGIQSYPVATGPTARATPPSTPMVTDEDMPLATPGIQSYIAGAGPAVGSTPIFEVAPPFQQSAPDIEQGIPPTINPITSGASRWVDTSQYGEASPIQWDYPEDDFFAGGGIYDDNTAIVGESGPELAIFPNGTEIVPLDRRMKRSQARRLRRRGVRGMQEGGFVFGPEEVESRGGAGNVGAVPGLSEINDPRYITNETLEGLRGGSLTQNPDDPYDIYRTDRDTETATPARTPEGVLQAQITGAQQLGGSVAPNLRGGASFEESLANVRGGDLGDLPIGVQQTLRGRSPRPLAGRLLRQAGMALPSAQAWRNLSPDEQAVYTDLARRSGISEGYLQAELATSMPSGGGGARRGRMLPLATRRGFRR